MSIPLTHKPHNTTLNSLTSSTIGFDEKPLIIPSHDSNTVHYLNSSNITQIVSESDYGNVEYKYKLCNKSLYRLNSLITQLRWRIAEGNGVAIYILGIHDNGTAIGLSNTELTESINTLRYMCNAVHAELIILNICHGIHGQCAEICIREYTNIGNGNSNSITSLRIGCIGAHNSGKSTLVGTLISNECDNGNGLSRMNVLKHRHEIESNGISSCISRHIIGFDSDKNIVNHRGIGSDDWCSIINDSSKVITLYDTPGHSSYIKTTICSLIGQHVDYSCVVIAADHGIINVTREHIGLAIALDIPIFITITKCDLVNDIQLNLTIANVITLLTSLSVNKKPMLINTIDDVHNVTNHIHTNPSITPIICISSVTNTNYNLLQSYLCHLPTITDWTQYNTDNVLFRIDESFIVPNVGIVVSGILLHGMIHINDEVLLGPQDDGAYIQCHVSSIHVQRRSSKLCVSGESCTLALDSIEVEQIRRGHVLINCNESSSTPRAVIGFDATIQLLNSPATGKLQLNYQSVLYTSTITQSTHITEIYNHDDTCNIVLGDTCQVRIDLCYTPEHILVDSKLIARGSCIDGRSKIIYTGIVTKLYYLDECQYNIIDFHTDSDDSNKIIQHKSKQRRLSLKSRLATHIRHHH